MKWILKGNIKYEKINFLFISFCKTVLPQTNKELFENAISKKTINRLYKMHYVSESETINFSENGIAKLYEQEIVFYRELEILKKILIRDYNLSVYDLFRLIDIKGQGFLNFER